MNDLLAVTGTLLASTLHGESVGEMLSIDAAIAKGNIQAVQTLLAENPETIQRGTHPRLSPLSQAIMRKRDKIALLLIESGANANAVDPSQRTPLHLCVERDLPAVAAALLKAGADADRHDKVGWTPLHHAAAKNRLELTRVLLKGGANPTVLSREGGTALHEAAEKGSDALVELLIAARIETSTRAAN